MKTQDLLSLRSASIIATLVLAVGLLALAQNPGGSAPVTVPHLIKFNGVLKDNAGYPPTGVVGITFALYKDQQGGAFTSLSSGGISFPIWPHAYGIIALR